MKKIYLLLFFTVCTTLTSQVNYPTAKQDLKELLAIQALLAENRMDELKTFFVNNNYALNSSGETILFYKSNSDGLIKDNDVSLFGSIQSGGKEPYADNYIRIIFFQKQNNAYVNEFSLEDCLSIKNIIKNTYKIGILFTMLEMENYKKTGDVNVVKIDRYNYKIYSDKNPSQIEYYKASNFMRMPESDKDNVCFFGPGKTKLTELIYLPPAKKGNAGKYTCVIEIASWKTDYPEKKQKFDVDFFMGLKDFNDRIWLDK